MLLNSPTEFRAGLPDGLSGGYQIDKEAIDNLVLGALALYDEAQSVSVVASGEPGDSEASEVADRYLNAAALVAGILDRVAPHRSGIWFDRIEETAALQSQPGTESISLQRHKQHLLSLPAEVLAYATGVPSPRTGAAG